MGIFAKKQEVTVEFVGGSRDGDRVVARQPAPTIWCESFGYIPTGCVESVRRALVYHRRPGQPDGPHLFYDFFRYWDAK